MIKKIPLMFLFLSIITIQNNTYATIDEISIAQLPENYIATLELIHDITHPDEITHSLGTLFDMLEKNESIPSLNILKTSTSFSLLSIDFMELLPTKPFPYAKLQ